MIIDIKNLRKSFGEVQAVKNTKEATELILKHPELFTNYEITQGKMDDVFLAVTGKTLEKDAV